LPVTAWGAGPAGITVTGKAGPVVLSAAQIAKLPSVTLSVSFGTDHGPMRARFTGPLLWTVLTDAKAIDPAKPRKLVPLTAAVTGQDGYVAAIALGEIAPAFEGKNIILAEQMNGKPLGPEHFRLVVPGDKRGGRSVRDVVSIAVTQVGSKQ
jgi:DMSO/TMAO reductase YedYZ molybdopterin-dependent catalytic subunit